MLDVACGSGRHVDLGLAQGLAVTGVDRSLDVSPVLPAILA
jgi:hypothetical protein